MPYWTICPDCDFVTPIYTFAISAQAVADYHNWDKPGHAAVALGADDAEGRLSTNREASTDPEGKPLFAGV